MSRVITQETFNDALKENITLFEMSEEDALQETIQQFKAQNVDLAHINKTTMAEPPGADIINKAIKNLKECNNNKKCPEEVIQQLHTLREECDKGLLQRVFAGKNGAYLEIITAINWHKDQPKIIIECFKTLTALMTKQPDLLMEDGLQIILKYSDTNHDPEIIKNCLKWAKECCVLHEMNRQMLYNGNILERLKALLNSAPPDVLREVLAILRSLVLDDDVRVEFGKAHDHARGIAGETLCSLIGLMDTLKTEEILINDLMLTLSALLVRSEFCVKVDEAGGIEIINEVMATYTKSEKVFRQCFRLLKALAGNDQCKAHTVQKGCAPQVVAGLTAHKLNVQTAISGLGCIAALTLRSPENSKAFFEAGAHKVILDTLELHHNDKNLVKTGSWAVRNMVSRSKYQCKDFIELGAENFLREALKKFPTCEYDIKAALRDLGCNIDLKEEWTGKGGVLTTSQGKTKK